MATFIHNIVQVKLMIYFMFNCKIIIRQNQESTYNMTIWQTGSHLKVIPPKFTFCLMIYDCIICKQCKVNCSKSICFYLKEQVQRLFMLQFNYSVHSNFLYLFYDSKYILYFVHMVLYIHIHSEDKISMHLVLVLCTL